MIQTIAEYLSENYKNVNWPAAEAAFRYFKIDIRTRLACAKHEFLCDCLHWVETNRRAFQDTLAKTDLTKIKNESQLMTAYKQTAANAVEPFVSQVLSVWLSKHPKITWDSFMSDGVETCVKYLESQMLPCSQPWLLVQACQKQPELGSILKQAHSVINTKTAYERHNYYENTLKPNAENLMSQDGHKETTYENRARTNYLRALRNLIHLQDEPDIGKD